MAVPSFTQAPRVSSTAFYTTFGRVIPSQNWSFGGLSTQSTTPITTTTCIYIKSIVTSWPGLCGQDLAEFPQMSGSPFTLPLSHAVHGGLRCIGSDEMTNPNYTHITMVVDRSGSMSSMREEAQNGINLILREQFLEDGDVSFSLRRRGRRSRSDAALPFRIHPHPSRKHRTHGRGWLRD